jgi:site-specific recombinase XerD
MTTFAAVERLIEVCRRQHKSLSTERTYAGWLKQFCAFVQQLNPDLASEKKVEAFLTWLAKERDVSASTQNQAFNALLFFYKDVLGKPLQDVKALRATRPDQVRYAPRPDE